MPIKDIYNSFIDECYNRYVASVECDNCANKCFCETGGGTKYNCSACLEHIQRAKNPQFSYDCVRMTYCYVVQFFNRFASELYRIFKSYPDNNVNIVSLGCGPGSELYGIIAGLSVNFDEFNLRYRGYDINTIWNEVQNLSISYLAPLGVDIDFHTKDLFSGFEGDRNEPIDVLVLNYILSDIVKFNSREEIVEFVKDFVHFIINHHIKNIVFNDISYWGYKGQGIDSAIKIIGGILYYLEKEAVFVKKHYYVFPNDNYKPEDWSVYEDDGLWFDLREGNSQISKFNGACKSKQIILNLKYQ